jgi:dTDP-4-dehydrorhamnose 3,5-epimerase
MKVIATALPEIKVYLPKRLADARGYFCEWYNGRDLARAGLDRAFLQDNVSLSSEAGTVRGLHFQRPPHAQAKLVGVLAGAALDVVVDIRKGSPRFGRHVAVELSAERGNQIFVPEGFAHGFCTLLPGTLLSYKVTAHYDAETDAGIAWDDPDLAIAWPALAKASSLSARDRRLPHLAELNPAPFVYETGR